jgi:hypothetical protein
MRSSGWRNRVQQAKRDGPTGQRDTKGNHSLDFEMYQELADALGDTPETVIATHLLRRGMCRVFVAGDPARFDGAIIQAHHLPTEPLAFYDPQVLWDLLQSVPGWECVLVESDCALALSEIMKQQLGVGVRCLDDVCQTMSQPAAAYHDAAVRELARGDLKLLKSAPPALRDACWESPRDLLWEGSIACAIVSGEIVATALTSAQSDRYAEIGVYTCQSFRRRGLATAAASLVVRHVQNAGLTPVWSAGEHNTASLRVAQKLGFREVSRRTYVIPIRGEDGQFN